MSSTSSGFGAAVIATCLVSHVIPSSSFINMLMPQSNKWQTSHNTCQVGPKNCNYYSSCNRSLIPTKLSAVNTSNESGSNESTTQSNEEQPNIYQMKLSQILNLLNRLNIRYAPDAKRSELEELLYQHYKSAKTISASESSQSTSKSRRRRQRSPHPSPSSYPSASNQNNVFSNNNIVDAIVLEEDDETLTRQESYKHRIKTDEYDRHQSHNYDKRRETTTDKTANRSTNRATSSSNQQSEYHRHRRRRRNNYDLYNRNYLGVKSMRNRNRRDEDMIDTFDIPDNERNNKYYDNGMQIFLMGFLEAGKTATQLALDSVTDAVVKPFSGEERWYDEERGREVLDVNILDYSPDYGRRTQRRYSSDGAGRRRRRRSETSRMKHGYNDDDDDIVRVTRNATRRRRTVGRRSHASTDDGMEIGTLPDQSSTFPAVGISKDDISTRDARMNVSRKRDDTKPIYGLYNGNTHDQPVSDSMNNETEHRSEVHPQPRHKQPKKIWKKRLRKKFDIALGLQSPISPSSSEELYDSWKTQVDGVHDGRKEVLRREMEVQKSSPTSPSPSKPNNRRARMRAKSSALRQEVGKAAKSYLDEPPFWRRDGGTIASVLFDSQPPQGYTPTGKGVQSRPKRKYNNSLDTLEAILRSPLGRQNTVTSLVAFIARYSLSWFGSLCRWAGVRGTIPQPIVVTAVFAMGISSRRGYRGLSVCLSLLALRMVGEFIHGSLHGNEFWEDEYSKESHEWTRE